VRPLVFKGEHNWGDESPERDGRGLNSRAELHGLVPVETKAKIPLVGRAGLTLGYLL
jgi:hypothetical protein